MLSLNDGSEIINLETKSVTILDIAVIWQPKMTYNILVTCTEYYEYYQHMHL